MRIRRCIRSCEVGRRAGGKGGDVCFEAVNLLFKDV